MALSKPTRCSSGPGDGGRYPKEPDWKKFTKTKQRFSAPPRFSLRCMMACWIEKSLSGNNRVSHDHRNPWSTWFLPTFIASVAKLVTARNKMILSKDD